MRIEKWVKCPRCGTENEGYLHENSKVMINGKDSSEFGCPSCNPHSNWTEDHLGLITQTSDPDERARLESRLEAPCLLCRAEMGSRHLAVKSYMCPTS